MTFPIEKKKDVIGDLNQMKVDLEKASKKLKMFAWAYNKSMKMPKETPLYSVTWKEIDDNQVEILFLIAVAPFINPVKIDNAFFKIAKDYDATIEKVEETNDITGTMFKKNKSKEK